MEPDDPRPSPTDPIVPLAAQDLERLSVEELEARIVALEAEIARSRRHLERAVNHRASADALFRRCSGDEGHAFPSTPCPADRWGA